MAILCETAATLPAGTEAPRTILATSSYGCVQPNTTTIPVVFHNLRGYDNHLIMQAISETAAKITYIPTNAEKYISFSLG